MASLGLRSLKPAGWLALALPLIASIGLAANEPRLGGLPVAMTLDVEWVPLPARGFTPAPSPTDPESGPKPGVDLAVSGGRIVEATAGPVRPREFGGPPIPPRNQIDGSWLVGAAGRGKVRIRIEAPLTADLTVRVGSQAARIGLASLLDGPQKGVTAGPQPTEVTVERLPWDPIQADLGAEDGTAEPTATVPLGLRFNVLTPEPAEVALRCSVEMRPVGGGEPVWRQDWREVVMTDNSSPPPPQLEPDDARAGRHLPARSPD